MSETFALVLRDCPSWTTAAAMQFMWHSHSLAVHIVCVRLLTGCKLFELESDVMTGHARGREEISSSSTGIAS